MQAEEWSVSRLAIELGIDRRTLSKRLTNLEPLSERKTGKRVDRTYRLAAVLTHLANPDDDRLDLSAERAKLARLQQTKLQLEIDVLQRTTVRVAAVRDHWQGMVTNIRAKLLALPTRLAAQVAPPDRLQEVFDKAQALIYEALVELAGDGAPPASVDKETLPL